MSKVKVYSHQIHAWKNLLLKIYLFISLKYLAAFGEIASNFKVAKDKINSGVTDPRQIFAQSAEDVVSAWRKFEAKRKTMTYLPYKY